MSVSREAIDETLANAREHLLAARTPDGYWRGELSSSALSTAVAAFALHVVGSRKHVDAVNRGMSWLARHRNDDGGWGDTTASRSNMSTTLLCWSALSAAARGMPSVQPIVSDAAQWITGRTGTRNRTPLQGLFCDIMAMTARSRRPFWLCAPSQAHWATLMRHGRRCRNSRSSWPCAPRVSSAGFPCLWSAMPSLH